MLSEKESDSATRAGIKKEMAKPRMAKSARTAELNLDTERVGKFLVALTAGRIARYSLLAFLAAHYGRRMLTTVMSRLSFSSS